jgi:uncharacterized protein (TIGR02246 family)
MSRDRSSGEEPSRRGVMRLTTLTVVALALSGACQPTTPDLTEEQKATLADSIAAEVSGFWDAWAASDVDQGMSFVADDATAVTFDGRILSGKATIDSTWRPMFDNVASQVIDFDETHITVFSSRLVCVQQRGTFTVTDMSGSVGLPIPFAYTSVWTRRDGQWQMVAGHRSPGSSQP